MAASTGSPASRRSTKLTPLTTRPSLTSRQGMTRTLNMAVFLYGLPDQPERFGGIDAAVIQRTAGNGAFEPPGARRQHRLDIIDGGEAAGGDHRDRDGIGQCDGGVPVDA